MSNLKLLDCTLRDGGYYNAWDFSEELIQHYLQAMDSVGIDYVELGLRSLKNEGFKGACAYTTDTFIRSLGVPESLAVAVMVNAAELVSWEQGLNDALARLFSPAKDSRVALVRIACHAREFVQALPAAQWLKDQGYMVAMNIMQIADRSEEEIIQLIQEANHHPVDVLYLADSMGSLLPEDMQRLVDLVRAHWKGELGVHTHDNMGHALENSKRAAATGATWIDATVTGMGRGPGNAKTEYLVLDLPNRCLSPLRLSPLLSAIRKFFRPMQDRYRWGTNPYYYLSGKYGIHPTYVQEMLDDPRYGEDEVLAVIEHLRKEGGKSFNIHALDAARNFFSGELQGKWRPETVIENRQVLLLGTGPGTQRYASAIEVFIKQKKPYVLALNTVTAIADDLIDARVACHPVRLLADASKHIQFPQPLIAPVSMMPEDVVNMLEGKTMLDFGFAVENTGFGFYDQCSVVPALLVVAYALAIATSGKAQKILLAGFDGYSADDPRRIESETVFTLYQNHPEAIPLESITPSLFEIPISSVYAQ